MRNVRAAILMLTAAVVLAAGLLPSCGAADFCCKRAETPSVHAQMPCCEPSVQQREAPADPTTAPTHIASLATQLVAVAIAAPRVTHTDVAAHAPAPQLTPPRFLLNAQFRI